MRRSRWTGLWGVLLAVFFTQTGVTAERDDAPARGSPTPAGGGGGAASVIPMLEGNPWGVDAVPVPSPSPTPAGGGGGGAEGAFIRVLPGGELADWTASPSPSPTGRPRVL